MVPNGWVKKTIDDIATVSSGGTPSRSEPLYWGGEIPWVTTAEVDFCEIVDTSEKITEAGLNNSSAKLFPSGTILMAMYGQGKTRGKVAKLAIEASTNQACAAILLKEDLSVDFYFQYLQSQYDNIRELSNSGGQENLSGSIVKSIRVPVPPLSEQKKIAKILSVWDKAITTTEQLLANSQQQKKALMQKLLTGKVRLLDENGVRFEGGWKQHTLSDFGKCIRGVSYKPENICDEKIGQTIRLLRSTNIQNGLLNDKDLVILPKDAVKSNQILKTGDLAICMANGSKALVGKSAPYVKSDSEYTVGAFCAIFRPSKDVHNIFVKFLFESDQYQSQLLVILAGSSINNLKGSDIESINITAPECIEEQKKIASVLLSADHEIAVLQKKLCILKDEKAALMQQLLTGKRRVKA